MFTCWNTVKLTELKKIFAGILGGQVRASGANFSSTFSFPAQVSWIRHEDLKVLATDGITFTSDTRLQVSHAHAHLHRARCSGLVALWVGWLRQTFPWQIQFIQKKYFSLADVTSVLTFPLFLVQYQHNRRVILIREEVHDFYSLYLSQGIYFQNVIKLLEHKWE